VIPAANTGKDPINKTAVIERDQTNNDTRSMIIEEDRILYTVTIKFIEAKIEETPAR